MGICHRLGFNHVCLGTVYFSHFSVMTDQPTPGATPDDAGNPVSWIAPTEAQRAKQLLDTHPHLVVINKELDWLPNDKLLSHAQQHVTLTDTKGQLAANRPSQTGALKRVVNDTSTPLTELRGVIKKKFKKAYEEYYPKFGLTKIGKNWDLPNDRDDLEIALRDYLIPALTTYGFQDDPDTGTAVWQPLLTRLSVGLDAAADTDEARSVAVGEATPLDGTTEKALRCLYHLALAHFPETWESVLRGWGWRKTSF